MAARWCSRRILEACVRRGARLAQPGEFTFRAYVHGRIELTQAEAVADLVESVTPLQARAAFDQLEGSLATAICGLSDSLLDLTARLEASLDFPEEGYHFVEPAEVRDRVERLRGRGARPAGARGRGPRHPRRASRGDRWSGRTRENQACSTGSRGSTAPSCRRRLARHGTCSWSRLRSRVCLSLSSTPPGCEHPATISKPKVCGAQRWRPRERP